MATVAVDFDGVIHAYSRGWADGSIYDPPLDGAEEGLRGLMRSYAVFIHTTRNENDVAKWVNDQLRIPTITFADDDLPVFWNSLDIILVTNRKLPAIAYIDDRGIRFESWDQALNDLALSRMTEWEKS